eukprot:6283207-Pyramimonas_sp.AAC.2
MSTLSRCQLAEEPLSSWPTVTAARAPTSGAATSNMSTPPRSNRSSAPSDTSGSFAVAASLSPCSTCSTNKTRPTSSLVRGTYARGAGSEDQSLASERNMRARSGERGPIALARSEHILTKKADASVPAPRRSDVYTSTLYVTKGGPTRGHSSRFTSEAPAGASSRCSHQNVTAGEEAPPATSPATAPAPALPSGVTSTFRRCQLGLVPAPLWPTLTLSSSPKKGPSIWNSSRPPLRKRSPGRGPVRSMAPVEPALPKTSTLTSAVVPAPRSSAVYVTM